MPAEFWYPISGATHDLPTGLDDFTNNGGANKNASCQPSGGRAGPMVHDDDTTYISAAAAGDQCLNIDWPGPIAVFNSMGANTRHKSDGVNSNTRRAFFSNPAGTFGGMYLNITNTSGTYADSSQDVTDGATYRPGGGAWVPADFTETQTMTNMQYTSGAGGTVRFTSSWGTMDYTPPSGGFAFLLGLAGFGALPIAGAMDFGQFLRFLSWRRHVHPRHTIMTGDEMRQAWRELREYRHPRFFFPAVA